MIHFDILYSDSTPKPKPPIIISLETVVKFKKFQIHIYLVQESWAPEEASF
jgi:hypothetical protein